MPLNHDYTTVTEISGDSVTQEQIQRLCNRYYWAGNYCKGNDVVECACGTGQGLGYLAGIAKRLIAGDYSQKILSIAKEHYSDLIDLHRFDAQQMPFKRNSTDIVILFEAIYYLPDAEKFVQEAYRILRPGGKVMISTANKDLYDFNPSPYSFQYYGVRELDGIFSKHNFQTEFFGDTPVKNLSIRQKILRPIKKFAVTSGILPESMEGKKFLKRLVFGGLKKMPAEIAADTCPYAEPEKIHLKSENTEYKVIYCKANKL